MLRSYSGLFSNNFMNMFMITKFITSGLEILQVETLFTTEAVMDAVMLVLVADVSRAISSRFIAWRGNLNFRSSESDYLGKIKHKLNKQPNNG